MDDAPRAWLPGWYPDPSGSGQLRWWDGTRWWGGAQGTPPHSPPGDPRGMRTIGRIISVLAGLGALVAAAIARAQLATS